MYQQPNFSFPMYPMPVMQPNFQVNADFVSNYKNQDPNMMGNFMDANRGGQYPQQYTAYQGHPGQKP